MTDWASFLKLDEFREYRKRQVQKVAEIIESEMFGVIVGGAGAEMLREISGQLKMARVMLKLPEELTEDKELAALLDHQTIEDMANLTMFLMRKRLNN